jgi:hypothetical protein
LLACQIAPTLNILLTSTGNLEDRAHKHLTKALRDYHHIVETLNFEPADASDVTPTSATVLFQRFLNLATYVRLRAEIAGGGDDLIGVFERAQRQPPSASGPPAAPPPDLLDDLAARLAQLSRRDQATVRGAMNQMGFSLLSVPSASGSVLSVPPLRSAPGLEKLWRLLRLTRKVGRRCGRVGTLGHGGSGCCGCPRHSQQHQSPL